MSTCSLLTLQTTSTAPDRLASSVSDHSSTTRHIFLESLSTAKHPTVQPFTLTHLQFIGRQLWLEAPGLVRACRGHMCGFFRDQRSICPGAGYPYGPAASLILESLGSDKCRRCKSDCLNTSLSQPLHLRFNLLPRHSFLLHDFVSP